MKIWHISFHCELESNAPMKPQISQEVWLKLSLMVDICVTRKTYSIYKTSIPAHLRGAHEKNSVYMYLNITNSCSAHQRVEPYVKLLGRYVAVPKHVPPDN